PAPPSGRPPPDDPQGHAWTQMPTGPDDSYYAPRKPRREKSVYTLGNSTITGKVQTVDSSPSDDGSAERINSMPIGQMRDAAPDGRGWSPRADRDDGSDGNVHGAGGLLRAGRAGGHPGLPDGRNGGAVGAGLDGERAEPEQVEERVVREEPSVVAQPPVVVRA
ncbi:hypothetical protein THAOC_31068, partial [Thalassiosira oceanica]